MLFKLPILYLQVFLKVAEEADIEEEQGIELDWSLQMLRHKDDSYVATNKLSWIFVFIKIAEDCLNRARNRIYTECVHPFKRYFYMLFFGCSPFLRIATST